MLAIKVAANGGLHLHMEGVAVGEILNFRKMANPDRLVLGFAGANIQPFEIRKTDPNYLAIVYQMSAYVKMPL